MHYFFVSPFFVQFNNIGRKTLVNIVQYPRIYLAEQQYSQVFLSLSILLFIFTVFSHCGLNLDRYLLFFYNISY